MKTVFKGFGLYSLIVTILFLVVSFTLNWYKDYKYNHISQEINLVSPDKQQQLSNNWYEDRENMIYLSKTKEVGYLYDIKFIDSLKIAKDPYSAENRIYSLRTELSGKSNTIYGNKEYITKMKCVMYKRFIQERKQRNFEDSIFKANKEKAKLEINEIEKQNCN